MSGFATLLHKEVLRFWKVSTQTIGAPVLTAALFLFIFGHVMEGRVRMYDSVPYAAFLVPGLVMMSLLQNAFANSSSSLIQSKITGNIIFVLLPPLAYWEFFAAYVLAAVVRGMVVGSAVLLVTLPFWQGFSHFNPFFYMIDGFRYGFFGVSDVHPLRSIAVVAAFLVVVSGLTLVVLRSGYKLRH